MNNKWLVIGLSIVIVVLLGVVAVGAYVFTQRPFAAPFARGGMTVQPGMGGVPGARGGVPGGMTLAPHASAGVGGFGFNARQSSLIATAAQDLNLQPNDLFTQLQGGKTIADLAKDKNVSTDKIVSDFVAARTQTLKTAVDAKQITQAQADAMLALAKANAAQELTQAWSPRANAFGGQNSPMPRGNFGGRGGGGGGMMNPNRGWH